MLSVKGMLATVTLLLCILVQWPAAAQESGYVALYEDAVRRLNKGDTSAALILAKNALLENPTHLPSRILLGNIYLLQGQGADAEKELKIALKSALPEPL